MNVEFVMTVRSPTFMSHDDLLRDFKTADVWQKEKKILSQDSRTIKDISKGFS